MFLKIVPTKHVNLEKLVQSQWGYSTFWPLHFLNILVVIKKKHTHNKETAAENDFATLRELHKFVCGYNLLLHFA